MTLTRVERYAHDAAGRLTQAFDKLGSGTEQLRADYAYDLAGRQVMQREYDAGGIRVYQRDAAYNARGQLVSETGYTLRTDNTMQTTTTGFGYGDGAWNAATQSGYALGAVITQSTATTIGNSSSTSTTTNGYRWFDGAQQASIAYQPATGAVGNTMLTHDALGRLTQATITGDRPRSVAYTLDEQGQVIRRDEHAQSGGNAPHEVWYRFDGRQLGYTGNDGNSDLALGASIDQRRAEAAASGSGLFRGRATSGAAYADFAQSYDPYNAQGQGSAGGSYAVQRGDTLGTIARALWGDAGLWYKLAEANGLAPGAPLIEGQRLTLPTGTIRSAHRCATGARTRDAARAWRRSLGAALPLSVGGRTVDRPASAASRPASRPSPPRTWRGRR